MEVDSFEVDQTVHVCTSRWGRGVSRTGWVVLEEGSRKDPHAAFARSRAGLHGLSKEALALHKSRQEIILLVTQFALRKRAPFASSSSKGTQVLSSSLEIELRPDL